MITLSWQVLRLQLSVVSGSFWYEADLVWDSTSNRLGGVVESISNVVGGNTVYQARTVFTGVAVTGVADLNFIPFFTFSVANAANTVTISEFAVDRAA